MYSLVTTYGLYVYDSIKGKGYIGAIIDPILKHQYYISLVTAIIILNTSLVIWEVLSAIIQVSRQERHNAQGYQRYKLIFQKSFCKL